MKLRSGNPELDSVQSISPTRLVGDPGNPNPTFFNSLLLDQQGDTGRHESIIRFQRSEKDLVVRGLRHGSFGEIGQDCKLDLFSLESG